MHITVRQRIRELQPESRHRTAATFVIRVARRPAFSGRPLANGLAGRRDRIAGGLIRRFLTGMCLLALVAAAAAVLVPGVSTALATHGPPAAVPALVRALTWGVLVAVGVSALLSRVVWANARWLLQGWRSPGSPARALAAGTGPEAAGSAEGATGQRTDERAITLRAEAIAVNGNSRPRPEPIEADTHRYVRAVLLILIAASLLWVAWQTPGPWQEGTVIAVTLPLAAGKLPQWGRTTLAGAGRLLAWPAQRCTRQSGALSRLQRAWAHVPAARRTTLCLLVLLNALTTLAVLDTARMSAGIPATHAVLAFAVMACVNLALMNGRLLTPRVKPGPARRALSPVEPAGAALTHRPPRHRHPHLPGPHPGEQGAMSGRRPSSLVAGPAEEP